MYFDQNKSFNQRTIKSDPYCPLQLFWWFSQKTFLLVLSVFYQILFKRQYGLISVSVSEESFEYFLHWNLNLTLYIIQPCLCFTSTFRNKHVGKPHYLIGQVLEMLPCNIISQRTIFHEARWMLISGPLFKFPSVHELIFCGLFEIFLPEFWLKILCERIADINCNYFLSCKG